MPEGEDHEEFLGNLFHLSGDLRGDVVFCPDFSNAWVLLAVSALVLTALIRTLESQGDRIEALEQRIQALEQAREHNAGEVIPGEEEESV